MRALAIIGTIYFLLVGTAFAKSPVAGDKRQIFLYRRWTVKPFLLPILKTR